MRPDGADNRKAAISGGPRTLLLELVGPAEEARYRRELALAQLGSAGGVERRDDDLDRHVACLSGPAQLRSLPWREFVACRLSDGVPTVSRFLRHGFLRPSR